MDRFTQGKCNLAFRKRDGWHNCRGPLKPGEEDEHVHDTSAGPPEVGDVCAERMWPTGYREIGIVSKVHKAGKKKGRVDLNTGKTV